MDEGELESVSFICMNCNELIKLDESFKSINPKTIQDLQRSKLANESEFDDGSFTNSGGSSSEDDKPPQIQEVPSSESEKNSGNSSDSNRSNCNTGLESINSFTFIGETNGVPSDSLSYKMKTLIRMFDIISGNAELDHPICEDCCETLLENLDKETARLDEETARYSECMAKLQSEGESDDHIKDLEDQLSKLKLEEASLLSQLEETEEERLNVNKEVDSIDKELSQLRQEEEKHLEEYADLRLQQLELEEEQISAKQYLQHCQDQLKKLQRTNVFNATFHIWHQGQFGTINGFRLGRLPGVHVEWSEINAAWGQVVLLLSSLTKKMDFKFKRYRLVPFGNSSYLESLDDKSKDLPLYGSGGLRFLWDTKFDHAMVAFLDCLQQFKEEVEGNSGFSLPYRMEKGKIEDTGGSGQMFSIKMQFNSEEQWTKALKFMLTNLKWGLAWVSSQFTPPPGASTEQAAGSSHNTPTGSNT